MELYDRQNNTYRVSLPPYVDGVTGYFAHLTVPVKVKMNNNLVISSDPAIGRGDMSPSQYFNNIEELRWSGNYRAVIKNGELVQLKELYSE